MTPDSRLYTFIDQSREYVLYFLEGQTLIQQLALLHPIRRAGFAYFRDVVLSIQPMIALLKQGEQFGFYIDSEQPYFRLKIETSHHGTTRCVLFPEAFQEFPEAMHGLVRVQKLYPNNPPYESVLKAVGLPLREIVNHVLNDSYQVKSAIMLSEASDQSVLLLQLPPPLDTEDYDYSKAAVRARREHFREALLGIFARALHLPSEIEQAFAGIDFQLLASRPVRFHCSCAKERMIENLHPVYQVQGDQLFDTGLDTLEVVCEYCKSRYRISREELRQAVNRVH